MVTVDIEIQGNSEQDEINAAGWLKAELNRILQKGMLWPHPEDTRKFDAPFDSQLLTTSIKARRA